MKCFDALPTVSKCCYCLPLKFGCYVIAFVTLFSPLTVPFAYAQVQTCYEWDTIIAIIVYGSLVMLIYSILVSFYFIYGLCKTNSKIPTWLFILMLAKAMVVNIITIFFILIKSPKEAACLDRLDLGAITTFDLFLLGYNLLIVNSYRIEDEDIYEDD